MLVLTLMMTTTMMLILMLMLILILILILMQGGWLRRDRHEAFPWLCAYLYQQHA